MKITCLNLAGYKNWSNRESLIIKYLDKVQSDIVFFQEVKYNPDISILDQAQLINSMLSASYQYSQSAISRTYITSDGKESREGLSVLSKYPIIESEILVLKKRNDDHHTRIIQNVDILVGGQLQKFTNVHFSNNSYSDEQLKEVLSIIKQRDEKRIIVGDFNIADINSVSHLFSERYISSFSQSKYISFPSEAATFDHILIPSEYKFTSFSLGENLSDHNALTFEI